MLYEVITGAKVFLILMSRLAPKILEALDAPEDVQAALTNAVNALTALVLALEPFLETGD